MTVAYCFLLYDTIQHLKLWEDYLAQDTKHTHTVYSHLKTVTDKTPAWIKKAKVRSVRTDWCGEGLIFAFNQMLKKALQDPKNTHFVLLSGSCIPLYTYAKAYRKIVAIKKARLNFDLGCDHVFEGRCDIYNGHQWCILNRKVAQDYIRLSNRKDARAQKFLVRMRRLYRENGVKVGNFAAKSQEDTTWLGGCPDEIYPINWLVELYGKPTTAKFKQNILNKMTTYTHWDFEKDPSHPTIFNGNTVKKAKKEICDSKAIFARKFTNPAAKFIGMKCT